MIDETQFDALTNIMARIEGHLSVMAELAQMRILDLTGEKTYQVQRFVVGRDGEDNPCIWLYGTHPGLEFAVTRIYHEYLDKLPLTVPGNAKVWDGEQAPSTDKAARGGYFVMAPAPFTISLLPTGKKTDAGHDIRRFSRVISIDGDPTPAPSTNGTQRAPVSQPAETDAEFDALPGHPRSAYTPEPTASSTQAPATPAARPAFMTTARPWTGDVAIAAMRYVAEAKDAKGEGLPDTDGRFGAAVGLLDGAPFDTDCRREFLSQVFGVASAKDLTPAQRQALVVWGKPAPIGPGPRAPWALAVEAVAEYRRILGWADETAGTDDEIPF